MEKELSKNLEQLIAQENMTVEMLQQRSVKDDDLTSSMDIDEFERRLKGMGRSLTNVDSDDDLPPFKNQSTIKNGTSMSKKSTTKPGTKTSSKNIYTKDTDLVSKLGQSQNDMYMSKGNATKSEDQIVLEIISSNNVSAKDKKLKELLQKNRDLNALLEKERALRQKYEKDNLQLKKEASDSSQKTMSSTGGMNKSQTNSSYGAGYKKYDAEEQLDQKRKTQEFDKKSRSTSTQSQMKITLKEKSGNTTEANGDSQNVKYLIGELEKKERFIKELLAEKIMSNGNKEDLSSAQVSSSRLDAERIVRLEALVHKLQVENDELASMKGFKLGNDESRTLKDLSVQNAQFRKKIEELETKLEGKTVKKK